MRAFTYERPTTIAGAAQLLAGEGARALAGGSDLIPQLREGRREARMVVDLKHIAELGVIRQTDDGGWSIGGAVSIAAMEALPAFLAEHRALVASARLIGSLQVQSRASLAGNLVNAAPSADGVPLLHSLGARVVIASAAGERVVAVDELAVEPGKTILKPGELVSALLLPPKPAHSGAAYLRFTPRREMDIAIAGSGVAIELGTGGEIRAARITLASVGPVPIRAHGAEKRLAGERPSEALIEEAGRLASLEAKPISDTRASADYRRHLVDVLTRRALGMALGEALASGRSAA